MFEGMHESLLDDEGKPMDLWHGTPGPKFDSFDDKKVGQRDAGFYGSGHYLTPHHGAAEGYADPDEMGGGNVLGPFNAALKNPFIWDNSSPENNHSTLRKLQSLGVMKYKDKLEPYDIVQRHEMDQFMQGMRANGHDGVIHKTPHGVNELVVFKPNLIKHRDAEVGDPEDARFMRSTGGRLGMHSKAAQIIRGLKQEKGTAEDMIRAAISKGAKRTEVEFAKPPSGKITRDELAAHFERNQPNVGVTKLAQNNFRYSKPRGIPRGN